MSNKGNRKGETKGRPLHCYLGRQTLLKCFLRTMPRRSLGGSMGQKATGSGIGHITKIPVFVTPWMWKTKPKKEWGRRSERQRDVEKRRRQKPGGVRFSKMRRKLHRLIKSTTNLTRRPTRRTGGGGERNGGNPQKEDKCRAPRFNDPLRKPKKGCHFRKSGKPPSKPKTEDQEQP